MAEQFHKESKVKGSWCMTTTWKAEDGRWWQARTYRVRPSADWLLWIGPVMEFVDGMAPFLEHPDQFPNGARPCPYYRQHIHKALGHMWGIRKYVRELHEQNTSKLPK